MKKTLFIIAYLGPLNEYQRYAITQLTLIEGLDLALILDNKSYYTEKEKFDCFVYCSDEVFNSNNEYGIKISDIKNHPYKLCDFKPILNKIFNVFDEDEYDFLGFGDLDCVFNPLVLGNKIKDINDINAVFGDRGHFMVFGKKTLSIIQNEIWDSVLIYRKKNLDLFNPKKGYAIDEFFFLHPILDTLDKKRILKWDRNYFRPLLDVDYKNLVPKNMPDVRFSFSGLSIKENNMNSKLSYIHLQKRSLIGEL
ncbi:hypothetical protein FNJ21_003721, partial [Vibrio fluvialis]|nr:hypothetical protein [Vibrio fluvialis]